MFSLQTMFGTGKQFYTLLDEAASAAHESTTALYAMLNGFHQPSLTAFKQARARERVAFDNIGKELIASFMTPIEREDIQALSSALYKIPKQVENFAERYALAFDHLRQFDFAPRAAMLEQACAVVVEMVGQLSRMNLDAMRQLNEQLCWLENEADRLMLELYRDIYSGGLDHLKMFLLKEFFGLLEKAIDRCREAGGVVYQIVLKNS